MRFLKLLSYFERRRRERLASGELPQEWRSYLTANVRHYNRLPEAEKRKLEDAVKVFVAEKDWEGCLGLEVTGEMRVTVAGQACLLALGFEEFYFDGVQSIVLYPASFLRPDEYGNLDQLIGEAHSTGTVVLSWTDARSGGRASEDNTNVVLHEFAHLLDMYSGPADGLPPIEDPELGGRWREVMKQEFEHHVANEARDEPSVLSYYGTLDEAEFFAVATEAFFQHPLELSLERPALYEVLSRWYRQDPASYVREPPSMPSPEGLLESPEAIDQRIAECSEAIRLYPEYVGAYLERAELHRERDRFEDALADYDSVLEKIPDDVQTWSDRGETCLELGDPERALADFNRALGIQPHHIDARVGRARALIELEEPDRAIRDLDAAIALDASDADAWALRGHAYLRTRDAARAASDLTRALELDPEDAASHADRGEAFLLLGEHDKALADLDRAVELDPDWPEAYDLRSRAREAAGDRAGARKDRARARRLRKAEEASAVGDARALHREDGSGRVDRRRASE